MSDTSNALQSLFDRVPRRHNADNVKEIYAILDEYEDLLTSLEADARYEEVVAPYFDALEEIRTGVKKSNDPKASKKGKDVAFDEASGMLKDNLEQLMQTVGGAQ